MGQSFSSGLAPHRGTSGAKSGPTLASSKRRTNCGCIPFPCVLSVGRGGRNAIFEEVCSPADDTASSVENVVVSEVATVSPNAGGPPAAMEDLVLTDVEDEEEIDEERSKEQEKTSEEEEALTVPSSPPPEELLSQLVAVDCGMINIPAGTSGERSLQRRKRKAGQKMLNATEQSRESESLALRRVCVIDGHGRTLLNATVRVPLTTAQSSGKGYHSGIARNLSRLLPRINRCGDDLDAGLPPDEARSSAASLLRDKIVVGHSVSTDLLALGLEGHPPEKVRDTALYPSFLRGNGASKKLRVLTQSQLGRAIQPEGKFHCCVEDAIAALDLYKLVWYEWEKSVEAGSYSALRNIDDRDSNPELNNAAAKEGLSASASRSRKRKKKKKKKKKSPKPISPAKLLSDTPSQLGKGVSLLTIFFFPILLPLRIIHDISRLTRETMVCSFRKIKLSCGAVVAPPSFSSYLRRRRRTCRCLLLFDSFILSAHCLTEIFTGVSLLNCDSWDTLHMRHANASIAVALVGMGLFVARSRNVHESQILFGILAQYHLIGYWIELKSGLDFSTSGFPPLPLFWDPGIPWIIATIDDNGLVENLMSLIEQSASALLHLMHFRDPGIPQIIPTISGNGSVEHMMSHCKESVGTFLAFLSSFGNPSKNMFVARCASLFVGWFGSLSSACHMIFFCWFALRSVSKLY